MLGYMFPWGLSGQPAVALTKYLITERDFFYDVYKILKSEVIYNKDHERISDT